MLASVFPSELKAISLTSFMNTVIVCLGVVVFASSSRTIFRLALASTLPSGLKASLITLDVCSGKVYLTSPVMVSHNRTALTIRASNRVPIGTERYTTNARCMLWEGVLDFACDGIP